MARVEDVAAYILAQRGRMTAMKLQKLCYYSQAWHLVWREIPLFDSEVEAWANGPVVYDLYKLHRGKFTLSGPDDIRGGNPEALDEHERFAIETVLDAYGDKSAHWLSELTHAEDPWRLAREQEGLADRERGNAVISLDSMFEYYDGLTSSNADEL
ncbi:MULTISPECIES: type II toxin-antitoxin system antitoxin SocA domain-containing protein [unclassified Pseudonocardia]|uniref:Panacea domain-containing protein n=1 Tax=unclassified Pseudonocardia TaxID=2619320 RepID=UPI00049234BE|nr:type II toxin-antitoxin system antitoxin SocA domain-containing protein [Pseudonocardia sp. Ae707_Ps1]OLM20863.1 putative prophage protein (ps3) [Pseudonocardia sp. Ae707_Ps1]